METRQLWAALERDEVEVHLQSEVWLEDGRHFGFEAQPRMLLAGELLGPERFLPPPSTRRSACPLPSASSSAPARSSRSATRSAPTPWSASPPPASPRPGSTTPSPPRFRPPGSTPSRLCIEVSADAPFDQLGPARDAWRELRDLGVRFAIDGCGRGAADNGDVGALPIGAMASFPFDYVRVDSSLIRAVSRSAKARRLVATIARTAADLEAIPVADGIETNTEAIAAFGLGCRVAQGPRFGLPLPPRAALTRS